MRAIVISMPKAGTYLAANLLQSLGLNFSHIHIDPGFYRIFKNNDLNDFVYKSAPLKEAISEIKEGSFAVGHIQHSKVNSETLQDFKKILIVRDLEEIMKSAERYQKEKGVEVFTILDDTNLKRIKRWSKEGDVFIINFEDIIDENREVVDNLQIYLFGSVITDSVKAIKLAKSQDSLTKSSVR